MFSYWFCWPSVELAGVFLNVGEVIFFMRILGYFHIIHLSLPSASIKHVISGKWKVRGEKGALFFFFFKKKKKKIEPPLNSEEDFTLDAGK
jgi:hypothetical protein